jgi:hypothetical protein
MDAATITKFVIHAAIAEILNISSTVIKRRRAPVDVAAKPTNGNSI